MPTTSPGTAVGLDLRKSLEDLLALLGAVSLVMSVVLAPFNLIAEDLDELRGRLSEIGDAVSPINGDDQTCFWFTAQDLDGNTLLVVDR